MLQLKAPLPFSVHQRRFASLAEHVHLSAGSSAPGEGEVTFSGHARADEVLDIKVRSLAVPSKHYGPSIRIRTNDAGAFTFVVVLPAGGWYVASLTRGDETVVGGPFAVGEVFLVSGQSYVGNFNDARYSVQDRQGRVAAYSYHRRYWRVAHDPQPCIDFDDDGEAYWNFANAKFSQHAATQRFDGGSVWPMVGDMLVDILSVPIGFANVSFGGTKLASWNPNGGPLYDAMLGASKSLGRFRAVLWAQGESDILDNTDAADWAEQFRTLKNCFSDAIGFAPDWLVAKSTAHPMAYTKPALERAMRNAIDTMWRNDPDVFPGPDTDRLHGEENRGGVASACHLTAVGQRRAAYLWFHAILSYLESRHP
jgi:hypothetical protein